jgi:hypothetical protein
VSNSTKAHIAALSLLDRAFLATTDDEIVAVLTALPDDHVIALRRLSGLRDPEPAAPAADAEDAAADAEGDDAVSAEADDGATDAASMPGAGHTPPDADELVPAIREAARKGRMNGDMQQLAIVMSDAALADCIAKLGDKADFPTEADLQGVLPGLVERHGVGAVRLMLAATVVGEAPASATIVGLLKNDDLVKLPAGELKPLAPLLPPKRDGSDQEALRQQRKERKAAEQAAAKLRREQIARAKHRV